MPFRRKLAPPPRPKNKELTANMAGVGMNFAVRPTSQPNIEDTLMHAAEAAMVDGDLRVLAVLTTWLEVHHPYVNADRLIRIAALASESRVRAFWAAVGTLLSTDRRFRRLLEVYSGPPADLLPVGTEFQLSRRGADPRFESTPLRVPAGTLRSRPADVLPPEALARLHRGYRNRIQMGPSWRTDVWTALEENPELSATEAAHAAYCSFGAAWATVKDFRLLHRATAKPRALPA